MKRLVIALAALAMGATFDLDAQAKGGGADIAEQRAALKQELAEQRANDGDSGTSFFESLFGNGNTETSQSNGPAAQ